MNYTVLLIFLALFALQGCTAKSRAATSVHYVKMPSVAKMDVVKPIVLKLSSVTAKPIFYTDKMFYRDENEVVAPYLHSVYSFPPVEFVRVGVQEALVESGVARAVLSSESVADCDYLLELVLLDFTHSVKDSRLFGDVSLKATLLDPKNRRVLSQKTFFSSVKSESFDAKGGVKALSQALFETLNETVKYIGIQ